MQLEFGPRRALIQNRDLACQFHIDLESRVYTAFELHEYRRPGTTSFMPKVESHKPSGRTVYVNTETIDTDSLIRFRRSSSSLARTLSMTSSKLCGPFRMSTVC